MKNGWQTKKLGEVATLQRGFDLPVQDRVAGNHPLLSSSGISDTIHKSAIAGPGVVTGRSGSIGNVFFVEQDFWPLNTVLYVKDFHGNDPKFVFHLLNKFDLKRFATGTGVPTLNRNFVHDELVKVPPLPEQRRIVGILDEAFAGIATAKANSEKNLQNARALFESHLDAVFTQGGKWWAVKRLCDLSRIQYGYTESASAEKVGPHFLRITDIQDNRVDWATVPYCPIDSGDLHKYKLADGDIVFARTGATTGKSYLVTNPPDAVFASYLIRVQLKDKKLLPQFVNCFFQTHSYWDIIRAGVSGSAQGGFNATKLGELLIPVPESSEEQQAIVAKLDDLSHETHRLESISQRKLAALDELKKSLLHQAFSGKL